MSLPPILTHSSYTFYSELVMQGFVTWGVHVMIVVVRHGLDVASGAARHFCGAALSMRHCVALCRMAPLLRVFFHYRLLVALEDLCPRWRVLAVTGHDMLFLHGHEMFGIRLGLDPFNAPLPYPYAMIGLTGEVTPHDVSFLLSRGSSLAARGIFCFERGVSSVPAVYRDHASLTLPVVPCFLACHDQRHVYVYHWTPPPVTLLCSSSSSSWALYLPGWLHSAPMQVLSAMLHFSVHILSVVTSHQDPST